MVTPAPERYFWNPKLHEEWGKARLCIWRLNVHPTIDRDAVLRQLKAIFHRFHILSFGIYEATGYWDFFVRIWLPSVVTFKTFEKALTDELRGEVTIEKFVITDHLFHWVWHDGSGGVHLPSPAVINDRLPDEEIEKINRGQLDTIMMQKYCQANIIAPAAAASGMKFIIEVTGSDQPFANGAKAVELLGQRLKEIILSQPEVKEPSLYHGEGFCQFLIMGRLAYTACESLLRELIDQINKLGIREVFGRRTYTHIALNSPLLSGDFQEHLPVEEQIQPERISIEEVLKKGEGSSVEFKGTAYVDIKKWISDPNKPAPRSDVITNEGILRAIVGMLNGQGGHVVVGVLEQKKFKYAGAEESLKLYPRIADLIVIGLALDYGDKDWDWFQLRLQDIINTRILPSARVWLTISPQKYNELDLCVVTVREPEPGDWFYLKDDPRFYVREGSSTRELAGPDADAYKRSRQRRD